MPTEVSTVENVSNLTWLIFATASILLWRYRLLPHLGSRAQRSLCALLCVLLLMFPIISISDDLHPDLVAAVEGESKSRLLKPADASHPITHLTLGAAALVEPAELPQPATLERLRPLALPARPEPQADCFPFRAPPPSSVS